MTTCKKLGAVKLSCSLRGSEWTWVLGNKCHLVFFLPRRDSISMSISLLWAQSLYSGGMPLQPRISKSDLKAYSSACTHRRNIFWMAADNNHLAGQLGRNHKALTSRGNAALELDVWISVHCFYELEPSSPRKPAIFWLYSRNWNSEVSDQT